MSASATSVREVFPAPRAEPRRPTTDAFKMSLAFLAVFFLISVDITDVWDRGGVFRYALILVPACGVAAVVMRSRARLRRPSSLDLVLFTLFAWGLAGSVYAAAGKGVGDAMIPAFVAMTVAFMYLAVGDGLREEEARRVLTIILVACTIYTIFAALVDGGPIHALFYYKQFKNANLMFVAMGLSAAIALRRWRWFACLVALEGIAFLGYPSLTTVLVFCVMGLVLYLTKGQASSVRTLVVVGALVVAIGVALANLGHGVQVSSTYFQSVGKSNSDSARLTLWQEGLEKWLASPLIGDSFADHTTVYFYRASAPNQVYHYPYHNDYVLMLAEGGLVGLGLLIVWMLGTELTVLRRIRAFSSTGQTERTNLLRVLLVGFTVFFTSAIANPQINAVGHAVALYSIFGLMMLAAGPRAKERATAFIGGLRRQPSGQRVILTRIDPDEIPTIDGDLWPTNSSDRVLAPPTVGNLQVNWGESIPTYGDATRLDVLWNRVVAPAETRPIERARSETSLRNRLLAGSAWVLGGRVITTVLGLAVNVFLARLLPPTQLGAYFTSVSMVMIGSTVAQLGLNQSVVRFVSASMGVGRPGRARAAIGMTFVGGTIGAIITGSLSLGLGGWASREVFHSAVLEGAVPLVAGWLVATALQGLTVQSFRGFQRFDMTVLFDQLIVDIITVAIFAAFWVAHFHTNVHQVLMVFLAVTVLVAGVGGLLLKRRVRSLPRAESISRKEMFEVAWPLWATSIATLMVTTGIDLWILGAFRSQSEVAIYGAATRLVTLVAAPAIIFQGVSPPIIAELYARGERSQLQRALRAMATLVGLPAAAVLLIFIFFGREVMGEVYAPFYAQGALILAILSASRLFSAWAGVAGLVLMMTGYQRRMMQITLISGGAAILAEIAAAWQFGAVGVACASAGGVVLQNVLQLVSTRRLTGIFTAATLSPRAVLEFLAARRIRRPSVAR